MPGDNKGGFQLLSRLSRLRESLTHTQQTVPVTVGRHDSRTCRWVPACVVRTQVVPGYVGRQALDGLFLTHFTPRDFSLQYEGVDYLQSTVHRPVSTSNVFHLTSGFLILDTGEVSETMLRRRLGN